MRFFAFGCSFTFFNWPTWADLLGYEAFYFNWGLPGVGNRAISERIVEAHTNFNFKEDDIIIIQWSHYARHDYAIPDVIGDNTTTMWKTKGSIFSPTNQEIFDKSWIQKFYNDSAYYMHTLNSILMIQEMLNSLGCKWLMTSINDIEQIRLDNGQENSQPTETKDFWEIDESLYPYREKIWLEKERHWLPPLLPEKWNSPQLNWKFKITKNNSLWINYFEKDKKHFIEPHLTTLQYHNYLEKNEIYDLLSFSPQKINDRLNLSLEIEEIKDKSNYDYESMIQSLQSSGKLVSQVLKGR